MRWSVYIILCSDGSYYTGVTTHTHRRFLQHREERGAKYFRGRRPLRFAYIETGHNRASAQRRERQIKALRRDQKQALIDARRFGRINE